MHRFILTVAWAHAQPTDPLARSDMALVRAWEQTPLTVRHATFVTDRPIGFGMYTKRPNDIFKPGEKLVVYAEPVGYGWKDAGNGMVEFGLVTGSKSTSFDLPFRIQA